MIIPRRSQEKFSRKCLAGSLVEERLDRRDLSNGRLAASAGVAEQVAVVVEEPLLGVASRVVVVVFVDVGHDAERLDHRRGTRGSR